MQPTGRIGLELRSGASSLEDEAERKLVRAPARCLQLMRISLGRRTTIGAHMEHRAEPIREERRLTATELALGHWMLEHGRAEAQHFVPQLEAARVVSRCPCGCASIDFEVAGLPAPSGGLHILGDYLFDDEGDLNGAFIFERNGVLSGIEVYGLAGPAPHTLPSPTALRPFDGAEPGQRDRTRS